MGRAMRAHQHDDHYPLYSKLMYKLPAFIVWLYYASSSIILWWFLDNFFCLVSGLLEKKLTVKNGDFFLQDSISCFFFTLAAIWFEVLKLLHIYLKNKCHAMEFKFEGSIIANLCHAAPPSIHNPHYVIFNRQQN